MRTLKFFSPTHVLITSSSYYFLKQITVITKNYFDKTESKTIHLNIPSVLINVFPIFGYLVFAELIELKCYDCNLNLQKNIRKRSRLDSITDIGLNEGINQSTENGQTKTQLFDLDEKSNSSDSSG